MPINWKTPEADARLLSALFAANGCKCNYKEVAHYFGQGATYNSVECRMRQIRKEGEKLVAEAGPFDPGNIVKPQPRSAATTPRKAKTPKKNGADQDGVISGRVTKNGSPKKKHGTTHIKQEVEDTSFTTFAGQTPESMAGGTVDAEGDKEGEFNFDLGQADGALMSFGGEGWDDYQGV